MKTVIGKILILVCLASLSLPCAAQMKIYTKSYRIQDFSSRTTKIVLGGSAPLRQSIRTAVTSLWTASPYEFCSEADYERLKGDPDSYFLRPVTSKGIISLELSKGGKDSNSNTLQTPMSIISVPVAGERYDAPLLYMPAFISIVQDYIIGAVSSERIAYSGIKSIKIRRPAGTRLIRSSSEAEEAFRAGDAGAAIEITITPDGSPESRPMFRYTVNAASYELYSFRK